MRTGYPLVLLVAFLGAALIQQGPVNARASGEKRMVIVEIRSYNLKPGTRREFHRVATEQAIPMLQRWKIDVVSHGPSAHDEDTYYLIRAFPSLAERQRIEDAFYESDEWKNGPRSAILARIENYTTLVLQLDESVVNSLRKAN